MKIKILSPNIINQIAAGEVIERPTSIVKELLENAIDAGATKISIFTEDGGKKYISVQDNGCGMSKDDLRLSLNRHATSKLDDNNLFNISSLGFRGEALPSISSIAKLSITSNDGNDCWQITDDEIKPAALPKGTKVEVTDIFFKIPARLKFLKSVANENSNILSVIQSLALSRPDIAFNFNNTVNFSVNKDSINKLFDRCQQVFGKDFTLDKIIEIDRVINLPYYTIKLHGYVSKPSYNKSTSLYQYCFVNNRPLKDKLINTALRIAYMDDMEKHMFPLCAFFIDIDNNAIDVNVHPCKYEIRFREANVIRGIIISTIKNAIKSIDVNPTVIGIESFTQNYQNVNLNEKFKLNQSTYAIAENSNNFSFDYKFEENIPIISKPDKYVLNNYPLGAAILQIDNKYLLATVPDGLILVDIHASHERILYEKFKKQLAENGILTQLLLLPEIVILNKTDIDLLMEHKNDFVKLGLIFDKFADDRIVIREIPTICKKLDLNGVIHQIVDEIKIIEKSKSFEDKLNYIIKTYACHISIRSGKSLTIDEMNALLREIEQTENADHCNHGRPTYVKIKTSDMDKLFHR